MRLAAILLFALAPHAWADRPEYEAKRGLINTGRMIVYYNSQGPLSFNSMTRKDLPKDAIMIGDVRGRSCQYALSIPLELALRPTSISGAHGNGSIYRALDDIRKKSPDIAGVFDMKVDLHKIVILGVFQRQCTEILARGFKF